MAIASRRATTTSRGGQLVPDEREQAAIAEMQALRAEGKSLRTIAAAMRESGFTISHEGVAEVLRRDEAA